MGRGSRRQSRRRRPRRPAKSCRRAMAVWGDTPHRRRPARAAAAAAARAARGFGRARRGESGHGRAARSLDLEDRARGALRRNEIDINVRAYGAGARRRRAHRPQVADRRVRLHPEVNTPRRALCASKSVTAAATTNAPQHSGRRDRRITMTTRDRKGDTAAPERWAVARLQSSQVRRGPAPNDQSREADGPML